MIEIQYLGHFLGALLLNFKSDLWEILSAFGRNPVQTG